MANSGPSDTRTLALVKLRPYQNLVITLARSAYAAGLRALLLVLPTGGGKTVCFSFIALHASLKGRRTWIIAHRQELIRQASNTLTQFGVSHGIIKAGEPSHPAELVQVASVQSLAGRMKHLAPPDLIVIDEAHHATSSTYARIMDAYPQAKILGVTATPCRLDGKGLGGIFDKLILGPTITELTDGGFLSPVRYFAPPKQADYSGVKIVRGDYATGALEEAVNKPAITGDAIAHYQKLCDGVPMLVFCISVNHAKDMAQAYRNAGYRATHVDGSLSDEERADRIGGLASGKYQIVTSCDLIGEGLDVPIVVAAQLLRPTKSLVLHLQQIGRVLRPAPGKEYAIILDHVGNLDEHGFASTEREWSLDGAKKKKKSDDEKDIVIKTCEQCYSVHTPAKECPYCGFVYPVKSRKIETTKGELAEIQATERAEKKKEQAHCGTLAELIALATQRGYKNPGFWARQIYAARMAGGRKRFS